MYILQNRRTEKDTWTYRQENADIFVRLFGVPLTFNRFCLLLVHLFKFTFRISKWPTCSKKIDERVCSRKLYLYLSVSVCTSVCLSLCVPLSVCLCVYLCLSVSVCTSVCLSLCVPLSVCLCVYPCLSVYRSVCVSACICICFYICVFSCMNVCLYLSSYLFIFLFVCVLSRLCMDIFSCLNSLSSHPSSRPHTHA